MLQHKESIAELIDRQSEVIRIQSECIDDLFQDLAQYVTTEELDGLPVLKKINKAASVRADFSRFEP